MDEASIFAAALELPDANARRDYLAAACAEHPDVLQRVQKLLSTHDRLGGFLENDSYAPTLAVEAPEAPKEKIGASIGPYKLIERIGEGGMGVVFLADQQRPVRRKVALKIIKPGMDTRQVIARFEAERQALALMDHPNITRVLDGGATESGRPYFVMDLVRGVPITEYCDAAPRSASG